MTAPTPTVHVEHAIEGGGKLVRTHVVSIRDPDGGLVAEFEGAHAAARWLEDGAYRYIPGTNGCWMREATR